MSEVQERILIDLLTFEKVKKLAAKEGTHRWDYIMGTLVKEALEARGE